MKGDSEIIEALNEVLTFELTIINQYYVHYKMCENWGYARLAAKNREESMEEMQHADAVIERILYLDGVPNMQRLNSVMVGETVPEQFRVALDAEIEGVARLNRVIPICSQKGDNGTRTLFEKLLKDEEDSVDFLEGQLGIIDKIGEAAYLAEMIHA